MNINWRGVLGGILFIASGLAVFVLFSQAWVMGFASLSWKKAFGTVIVSDIHSCRRKYQPPDYVAEIIYQYAVDGVSYSSKNISFTNENDTLSTGCGHGRELAGQYPKGKNLVVYYDPADPKNAVLLPGGTNFLPIGCSLGLIALGVLSFAARKRGAIQRNYKKIV